MAVRIAGDHHAHAQALGLGRESRKPGPAFQAWTSRIAAQGHEVIKELGVLEDGQGIGLAPDPQHLLIRRVLLGGLDPKAQSHRSGHTFSFLPVNPSAGRATRLARF